jgi:hypothetical protein
MDTAPAPEPPPVNPAPEGGDQLYVVPGGTIPSVPLVGDTIKPAPLQIVAVIGEITGLGLTDTITVKSGPVQLPAAGVTLYIAVCKVFVGLVSVPLVLAPLPDEPPERPPVTFGATHV